MAVTRSVGLEPAKTLTFVGVCCCTMGGPKMVKVATELVAEP